MSKKNTAQQPQKQPQAPQDKPATEKPALDADAAQRLQAAHKAVLVADESGVQLDTSKLPPLTTSSGTVTVASLQGSPAGDPSNQPDEPTKDRAAERTEQEPRNGAGAVREDHQRTAEMTDAQLERAVDDVQARELFERLRALSKEGEPPSAVLDRLMADALVIEEIVDTEHPHAALVSLVQTGAKPERYTLRLMEKTHAGNIAGTTLCKSKSWGECRDTMARIVSTRVVPEPFRE